VSAARFSSSRDFEIRFQFQNDHRRERHREVRMIVCICQGVDEREIRRTVAAGARTMGELMRRCGAGTDCGSCHQELEHALDRACAAEERAARPMLSLPLLCPT
jgi:bacterioferritin-associated ferredoxin